MRKARVLAAAALLAGCAGLAAGLVAALHPMVRRTDARRVIPPGDFATVCCKTRGAARPRHPRRLRIVHGRHDAPVPILMYHLISSAPPQARYPQLYVRPSDFGAQMRWLAARGYHAVTLQRVWQYWRHGYALPRRPVVITFDDGYLSEYTRGLPILRAHDWPAVLNLQVSHLDAVGGMLPWRVRNLIGAGWEIDAHTFTHPDLTTVGAAQLQKEVAGSRTRIRREFHVPVDFFCYPAGKYDTRVLAAVRRAGYLGATTVRYGLARPGDAFTLDRIRIDASDGLRGFASKLQSVRPRPY